MEKFSAINTNCFFSIILPVYNGEEYLQQAIESILFQTFTNFELIIIDDGSSDSSAEIIRKYKKKDSRIVFFQNPSNLSLPESLNIGHRKAKGAYLTWTSHDNILKPDFLLTFHNVIKSKDYDVIYSNYDIILSDGKFKRVHTPGPLANLIFGNYIGASFVYKRSVFKDLKGFKTNLFLVEDHDFFLRAALKFSFHHLKENLYQYRLHQNSLTIKIQNDLKFAVQLREGLNEMYNELELDLHTSSKNLIMGLYLEKAVLDLYIENKQKIRNDLRIFESKIQEDFGGSVLNHLEFLLRLNWIKNINSHSLKTLIKVIFQTPELLFRSNHNKNFSLKIIYLSFTKFFRE